ncbi:MAG: hypothetical protein LBT43_05160 [Prevotella sp.]|jgi:hypothetical protein|nr:hypothetical protein [Prevotella sp.]
MTNRIYSGLLYFILSVCICFAPSCTYDYFEDESNYVIYVPKADMNTRTDTYKINDISIFIYNSNLEKERYSSYPFEDNARTRVGNFNFKLFPGEHSVYCFTNISGVNFSEIDAFSTARFGLKQNEEGYYEEPSVIFLESMKPFIHFPGPVVTDTAWFEKKYVGRICVAFKNMTNLNSSLTFSNIKKVEILAKGVGVTQYLSQIEITDPLDTRSSRNSIDDKILLTSQLSENPYPDFDFGFDNYYFPSLSPVDGVTEPISLQLSFLDENNDIISTLAIDLIDRVTGEATILHMDETILVTVDGNNIQILRLEDPSDWNSDIESGGNNTPGGGGTEI